MSVNRKGAMDLFLARPNNVNEQKQEKISSYFGENVFTEAKMRNYLPPAAFKSYKRSIVEGKKINKTLADQIASALKA